MLNNFQDAIFWDAACIYSTFEVSSSEILTLKRSLKRKQTAKVAYPYSNSILYPSKLPGIRTKVCVCVCVSLRERERERGGAVRSKKTMKIISPPPLSK